MAEHLRRLRLPQPFARHGLEDAAVFVGALQGIGDRHREQATGIVRAHRGDQVFDHGHRQAGSRRIVHQHPIVADFNLAAEFAGHRPQAVGDTLRAGIAAAAQDAQFGAEFRHRGRRPMAIVGCQHDEHMFYRRRGAQCRQGVADHGLAGQRQVLFGHGVTRERMHARTRAGGGNQCVISHVPILYNQLVAADLSEMTMSTATAIRPPAVAGMFYPGDPAALRDELATCLSSAVLPAPTFSGRLKALIVPHAGYVYSGGTAGKAYALLAPLADRIRRVVLLGPCHRVAVNGLAAHRRCRPSPRRWAAFRSTAPRWIRWPGCRRWSPATPPMPRNTRWKCNCPSCKPYSASSRWCPWRSASTGAREVAEVIARLWGGPETLIVISSDLSHFHAYAEARRIDGMKPRTTSSPWSN
jgi:hypothetical protein